MKTLIIAILTITSAFAFADAKKSKKQAPPAHAAAAPAHNEFLRPYGQSGCGLGSLVVGRKGNQILGATTNGTSGNQTFAMSTGTLNCSDDPTNRVADNVDRFIVANRSALTADIAKGSGETVAALGQVLGCSSADSKELGSVLQKNYSSIFGTSEQVAPNEVTDKIITVIINNQKIASQCNLSV